MVFSSPTFLFIFLPAVFLSGLIFKSIRVKNALLLFASLIFYAWGEPYYVLLMIFTTLINYLCSLNMRDNNKLRLVTLAIIWNIGSLIFFKYTDFLLGSINGIFNFSIALTGIPLPIGISFFTFQAMSYTLDVYRGDAKSTANYFDLLLYISLFPQLIAGPIVKYHDVDEQIKYRELTLEKTALGFRRFSFGLAKKVLIANVLALTADNIFALDSSTLSAATAWLGAFCYLFQIYFDFSGYSDMAIGLGQIFGFEFKENFLYPYAAQSMQDFWRRWHISLSTWFKLYVYIPLGGNRKGKLRTSLNKLIVFLLTGLWHGASWTFAVWGLVHGFFLTLESLSAFKLRSVFKPLRHAYVLTVATVTFVLFRSESFTQAFDMLIAMFTRFNLCGAYAAQFSANLSPALFICLPVAFFACTPIAHNFGEALCAKRSFAEALIYVGAFLLFVLSVLCLSTSAYNPFIYFRF